MMNSRRDNRGGRSALFDGLEEGINRASASYSTHEISEHDNERDMDGLQDKVSFLKRLTTDIHVEVESQNRMLDFMGNQMDASRGMLSGTVDRFKKTGLQASAEQEHLTRLSNRSFGESLLPAPAPIPDWYVQQLEVEQQVETNVSVRNTHTLLTSSCDDDKESDHDKGSPSKRDKSGERRKRREEESHRHERKKQRRKKKLGGQDDRKVSFGQDVWSRGKFKRWVDVESKDFQFDARGDRDNLVYGSLYRKQVPLFYRHRIRIWSKKQANCTHSFFGVLCLEEDGVIMDEKSGDGRYWSAKFASLERRKDFRRLKIRVHASKTRAKGQSLLPCSDFISIEDFDAQQELKTSFTVQEESWDGYVLRKTKEFNQQARERPQDESLWIAFANFQDELIKATAKKSVAQQAVEKKIAILEKALEIHPFSEDLWLLFLDTCGRKDLTSALQSKWEYALKHIPGSYRVWRGYLRFRLGEFSLFTVSSIRKLYMLALQTYFSVHSLKDHAEKTDSSSRAETEKNLVLIFVDLCWFEWQTGHHELAVGLFQALIEYNFFPPPLDVSERSKKRLFSEFWDSGAPRVGEDGAFGWALWLQKEEEWIQKALAKDETEKSKSEEEERGGWTGWYEPVVVNKGREEDDVDGLVPEDTTVSEVQDTDEDEEAEVKDVEENDQDEGILLERLGLNLQAENDVEVKDSGTWKRWSDKEHERDALQWLPIKISNLKAAHDEASSAGTGEEEQLERAVLFEDIQECLFSLASTDARLDLICHFVDFCTGPYPKWCCSNSPEWLERMETLEKVSGTFLKETECASPSCETDIHEASVFEKLVGGVEWIHESQGRCNFVVNALLLLRPFFSNNFWLEEKLLHVEDHRYNISSGSAGGFGPRVLAKRLLKNDRQAILLLGAYARAEASAGNLDIARKVFDTTLASLSSLPTEMQSYGPTVYEHYAEMELLYLSKEAVAKEATYQKVLHILSCLGCGIPYTPFRPGHVTTFTDILKTRRGFKEQIQNFRKERKQPESSDQFKSVVVCASMFELMVDGLDAAVSCYKESFSMSLPGKQQQSLQFELLHLKYIRMLEDYKHLVKPKLLRHRILQALAQYPNNPKILGAYIRCSSRTACTNDLRRFFDNESQRNATTVKWLFAIAIELGRPGSGPRIHSLFEKALGSSNTQQSVVLWRCYIAYELKVRGDFDAARRVYFRAIHACPWSKLLWLDGFRRMSTVLSTKELSEFQDIMREKELRIRTDVYEILLEEEAEEHDL